VEVLHVVASHQRRGAEVFASDLVRSLKRSGIAQHVAVLHGSRPGVEFWTSAISLKANGRMVPGLRMDSGIVRSLRSVISQRDPDVIQAHGGEPLKYALAARGRRGIPLVYRRIGAAPPRITRGVHRVVHGALMRRATKIVAVADVLRQEIIETFRVPPPRVVTIPNAVDPKRLFSSISSHASRRALGIPSSARVMLSVGALTWEKDPLGQVEVAAQVLRARSDAVLVFIGDGQARPSIERAVHQAGIRDRVFVLGSRSDVAEIMAAGDVVLLASRSEGMPACVIEAGLIGLPVVATAVAGVSEVVVDGRTGFLVPPGDQQAMASRILALLEDEAKRASMGQAARQHCLGRFDVRLVAPKYLGLYEGLLR
jgi:glycosyltransferase involved in cell wall biosynthesis